MAMRRWLACACVLALACPPGTPVGQAKDLGHADEAVARGVLAQAVFYLYHELGHALVRLLELPVVGSEEDAVDGFAVVRTIANRSGMYHEGLVADMARLWYLENEDDLDDYGSLEFFSASAHGLPLQRHYATVCLLVGSDPEGRRQFAIDAGMPEERIEECGRVYDRMREGWERFLEPHAPDAGRRRQTRRGRITVTYKKPAIKKHRSLRKLVEDSGVVQTVVEDVKSLAALPKDVRVVFRSCGESNAFFNYNGGKPRVVMCYELLSDARRFAKRDFNRPPEPVMERKPVFPNMSLDEERTAIFVLGNTLFAVYHELATALVLDLSLPLVTEMADAADGFAAISMIKQKPKDLYRRLVIAAANGWYLEGAGLETSELAYWSGDGVGKQRHFAVLCLLVGSDPEVELDFGRAPRLPLDDLARCDRSMYQPMVDGWKELLQPHRPSARANASGDISLAYEEVEVEAHAALRDLVRDSGLVEEAVDKVMGRVGLPRDLQVVFMDCKGEGVGDDPTFFDADGGRAVICYSFLARLEEMGKDALARQII